MTAPVPDSGPLAESPEFDHLLHCVPDVDTAASAYTAAGLPAHANPPYLGYRNGAWRLDTRYVELVSVVDRAEFEDSPYGVAMADWMPHIDTLVAEGGGALNFAVHVGDVGATTERLRRAGHRVELTTFAREGSPVSFREAILPDAPIWAPFFITYTPTPQVILEKYSAGRVARGPHDLAGFVIETPDPLASAAWLSELTGVPLDTTGSVLLLPGCRVHFAAGPADRITTLLLKEGTPPTTTVHGLALRPAEDPR
ncbi:VOC family protein [Streptomyces sp. MST-110588]|uniref:VOC family protein n=1 Tax=Streptomyces sp. MST-110588 TaxID=2833628 RepID=UPI001F5C96B5|nr:VOC family protein [Streptomyces sp. MST-110588]UNO40200.1 VOC family protein [Streptomyces sp. MST-110588]